MSVQVKVLEHIEDGFYIRTSFLASSAPSFLDVPIYLEGRRLDDGTIEAGPLKRYKRRFETDGVHYYSPANEQMDTQLLCHDA